MALPVVFVFLFAALDIVCGKKPNPMSENPQLRIRNTLNPVIRRRSLSKDVKSSK